MEDQKPILEMTTEDARALLQNIAERMGVSVENLVAFVKKGARGDLITSPEKLKEIANTIQKSTLLNRRQRRKMSRKHGKQNRKK